MSQNTIWQIAVESTSQEGRARDLWKEEKKNGFIAINDWDGGEVPLDQNENVPNRYKNYFEEIKKDDLVIANFGQRNILGIGKVKEKPIGDYKESPIDKTGIGVYQIQVEWIWTGEFSEKLGEREKTGVYLDEKLPFLSTMMRCSFFTPEEEKAIIEGDFKKTQKIEEMFNSTAAEFPKKTRRFLYVLLFLVSMLTIFDFFESFFSSWIALLISFSGGLIIIPLWGKLISKNGIENTKIFHSLQENFVYYEKENEKDEIKNKSKAD